MKKILFHYPDLDRNRIFTPDAKNIDPYGQDPFLYLKERFAALGYDLVTSDDIPLSDCEFVIFHNAPISSLLRYGGLKNRLERLKRLIKPADPAKAQRDLLKECIDNKFDKIAIILWDNDAISPGNFSPLLHSFFPVIFTWHDDLVDNKKFFKLYPPIARRLPEVKKVPFAEKKLLVNVSRNRYSPDKNDLYVERRRAIDYFERHFPDDFDLYGRGWNKPVTRLQRLFPWLTPIHKNCRGSTEDKGGVMSGYKFSLCYENLKGEKGYITEKIFDGMRYNTVPIYWGAENVADFIDQDAYIDRRKFKSNKELADYLVAMTEEEYDRRLAAIDAFLKSDRCALFLPQNFADTIINNIRIKSYAQSPQEAG